MKLTIKNINKVKSASIKLDGLTVIAGANSSGKSTVGKLLFSMVKAQANAEFLKNQSKEKKLRKSVEKLYKRANGCFSRLGDKKVADVFPLPISNVVDTLLEADNEKASNEILDRMKDWINTTEITPRMKSLFMQDIDNVRIALGDNKAADIASEAREFIESEFMNKICSHGTSDSEASLEYDNPLEWLQLKFKDDRICQVNVNEAEHLRDATYVESPLYLHILDTLLYAATYQEYQRRPQMSFRGMVPIHIKDLASKISSLQLMPNTSELSEKYGLTDIMSGRFVFDDTKALKFVDEKTNNSLSPINIASGIKSFGLVQILLETHVIGNDKILIWDEPENHLHPKWQVAFAEVLVRLAHSGIPIVISTHSPYFVQGVRYFSAKYSLEQYTNFYLAEEDEDGLSVLNDVTSDLNQIFSKLAAPLRDIMNVDEARQNK